MTLASLTALLDSRADARADLGLALDYLRRMCQTGGRPEIETAAFMVQRHLIGCEYDPDDADEISDTVIYLKTRVRFAVCERLRPFLLALVEAVQAMCETAEE